MYKKAYNPDVYVANMAMHILVCTMVTIMLYCTVITHNIEVRIHTAGATYVTYCTQQLVIMIMYVIDSLLHGQSCSYITAVR